MRRKKETITIEGGVIDLKEVNEEIKKYNIELKTVQDVLKDIENEFGRKELVSDKWEDCECDLLREIVNANCKDKYIKIMLLSKIDVLDGLAIDKVDRRYFQKRIFAPMESMVTDCLLTLVYQRNHKEVRLIKQVLTVILVKAKQKLEVTFDFDTKLKEVKGSRAKYPNLVHFFTQGKIPKNYKEIKGMAKLQETFRALTDELLGDNRNIRVTNRNTGKELIINKKVVSSVKADNICFVPFEDETLDETMQRILSKRGVSQRSQRLFLYLLSELPLNGNKYSPVFDFDARKYCETIGIDWNLNNVKKIEQDFSELIRVCVSIEYEEKRSNKKSIRVRDCQMLQVNYRDYDGTNIKDCVWRITLPWIDINSPVWYMLFPIDAFKEPLTTDTDMFYTFSLYVYSRFRMEYMKAKKDHEVGFKIGKLVDQIGISEKRIKKYGWRKEVKEKIEQYLTRLEKYGISWRYKKDNCNSKDEYLENVIYISDQKLLEDYQNRKKKGNK